MNILIEGMEMPVSCGKCPFKKFVSWGRLDNETGYVCLANENIKFAGPYTFRNPDCPLVLVSPHGRLIDADALIKSDRMVGKLMMYGGEYVYTQTEIDRSPTIIPASEKEE